MAKSGWLPWAILRAASLLVAGGRRSEWLEEWRSELWYAPPRGAARFCLGAFEDAYCLRRDTPGKRPLVAMEGPFACLFWLSLAAAICGLIATFLTPLRTMPSSHVGLRSILEGSAAMLLPSCVYLPAVRVAMGHSAARPQPINRLGKFRLGFFLSLKIVLVQPILFCSLLVTCGVPLGTIGFAASWSFLCYWILRDQQRRCPVCLRLLTEPVRIGTPSQTFLEWYGVESVCSRGHGLLHEPETSTCYSGGPRWLHLDPSWSAIFAGSSVPQR